MAGSQGRRWRGWLGSAALAALWPSTAGAVAVASVAPQGEVAEVRQAVVTFSDAVVPAGDPRRPAPAELACTGAAPKGSGRWLDERRWAWDFAEPLPPGVRCTLRLRADWKPMAGELQGATEFRFGTGGPAILRSHPWAGATVEEDTHFLLELSGAAVEADVLAQAGCEVEGLAERLPLRLADAALRQRLIELRRLKAAAARVLVVQCARPLPPGAKMRLVWGQGIGAAADPQVRTKADQRLDFRVRPAFTAEFSCERERAQAPCLPIRPLVLRFSAPVDRAMAAAVRLRPAAGGAAIEPQFGSGERADEVSELSFPAPRVERARFQIELPPGLKDRAGRTLANAASFPLAVATGDAPPIARFAAAPFGVVEWGPDAAVPVTLRHVQGDLRPQAAGGRVSVLRLSTDADIVAWYRKLGRHHETQLPARELGLPQAMWTEVVQETDERGRVVHRRVERQVGTREVSLLAGVAAARRLDLPQLQGGDPRPFEVVGIPLGEPGYHVLEIESRRLGQALLDKAAPMYVRTGVLVTNLGVHFKQGRENAAVWVTTLDRARPVADAEVALTDCRGQPLWSGRTGPDGVARVPRGLKPDARCERGDEAVLVSARKADAQGRVDLAFVWNGWVKGIEPWRFALPFSDTAEPDVRAHTVFDRTLLRAGETVSMKHFVRREGSAGLALPDAAERPTRLTVVHDGSGERFSQPLQWTDGRSATSSWNIPAAAKLGLYRVELDNPDAPQARRRVRTSGDFRVEAFRVPLIDARLYPPRGDAVAPSEVVLSAQLQWASGGPLAAAALRGTALLRPRDAAMPGWPEYSFEPPRERRPEAADDEPARDDAGRLVADRVALTTDREGAARFAIGALPAITRPSELQAELSYADPNGEQQTVSATVPLWPAALALGVRAPSTAVAGTPARFTVVAVDLQGKPLAHQAVRVSGRVERITSTRKRIVGGFYAYDHRVDTQDLGELCRGSTDARGLLVCSAALDATGQVELIASAADAAGRATRAAATVWVPGRDAGWFEQDNDDRIDVLPDKRRYEGGDTAKLQVRMPFREATAWVTVEREGVIDTRVLRLSGDDPVVELKIDPAWGPNVYVGVLAVRGRIRHVPWNSFFDWGWKTPVEWARAWWGEGREYQPPTAMVDLSRPAFKFGVAALQVGLAAHELQVQVTPDQPRYGVRATARVRVKVTQGGQPVPDAEVAFAAVDEGLLALRENTSWQLLDGLMRPRPWGVQTATAASEIIGRRHYGRKAVPAGGGGGRGATRELFDTLLLWKPRVALDARGEALIDVPLNDSLTAFRLVAVADAGVQRFGHGSASVRVTQDLQVLAGLPPLVREGDRFAAALTLRNTTAREMKLRVTLQGAARRGVGAGPEFTTAPIALPPQDLTLAAGAAREVTWNVEVPADAFSIGWEAAALEAGGAARDALKWTQFVAPAVPVRVWQAALQPLDGTLQLPVAPPAGALAGADGVLRGGLRLELQPTLAGALPGVRRFFETYPYGCLEQKASKAIALRDEAAWRALAGALPGYLDDDGLAAYFPMSAADGPRGSDRLTAHLLAAAHEAGFEIPAGVRERLLAGLTAFVEGRIERRGWAPRADLEVRKLAALEALSRHGRALPRQLGSLALAPQTWPTSALIDWLQLLQRVDGIPERARRLDEARALLRSRLVWSGTTLRFSTEDSDDWSWLMDGPDVNAVRLLLAGVDDPSWKDELPRLLQGALARQNGGAWRTTTANVWGVLAVRRFSARFESVPVAGRTQAAQGAAARTLDWAATPRGGVLALPWPAASGVLALRHEGAGKPWVTLQGLAAVPLASPLNAGYAVTRSVVAVERKDAARWSRGDVLRVRLEVQAAADMAWVVVSDPVPGGASILGSGLGRDSALATRGESTEGRVRASWEERTPEAWRAYFEHLPRGRHVLEYTVRLNHPGRYALPPTRVEAMYAPEVFGELPNAPFEVAP